LIRPAIAIAMPTSIFVSHQPPRLLVVLRADSILHQRGVQPDHVRHHRRTQDSDCQHDRAAAREAGHDRVPPDRAEIRPRLEELDDVARPDREHDHPDRRLERPEAEPLQPEDEECRDGGENRGRKEPDPEQKVHAERGPEELGEVGRDRDRLRLQPEPDRDAPREAVAADLGEVPAGGDPELGRERLDEHRHQVRHDDHPDERVPVPRAAGDVGREVARVDVRDRSDEGGAEEREQPEAGRAAEDPLAAIDRCLAHRHKVRLA
jgi:hypothetical protein